MLSSLLLFEFESSFGFEFEFGLRLDLCVVVVCGEVRCAYVRVPVRVVPLTYALSLFKAVMRCFWGRVLGFVVIYKYMYVGSLGFVS